MAAHRVVGIDGYRHGWVSVMSDGAQWSWATASVDGFADLCPPDAVVGVDMPIGILASGQRDCDLLAKRALGRASSRVFITPPRDVLELGLAAPNDAVQAMSKERMGSGVSRQALGLASRILVVDAFVAARPAARVVEVHPEISFARMAGSGPLASKKSAAGVGQRISALLSWLSDAADVVGRAPSYVPIDDALDALACAWSAGRWAHGEAELLPERAIHRPFIAT